MSCKECARLRKALSPLEDPEFTAWYLAHEPTQWLGRQRVLRKGVPHLRVSLPALWAESFGGDAGPLGLTKLGRTLQALGWSRTKIDGRLFFVRQA